MTILSYIVSYVIVIGAAYFGVFAAALDAWGNAMASGVMGGLGSPTFFMEYAIPILIVILLVFIAVSIIYRAYFVEHRWMLILTSLGFGLLLMYPAWVVLLGLA